MCAVKEAKDFSASLSANPVSPEVFCQKATCTESSLLCNTDGSLKSCVNLEMSEKLCAVENEKNETELVPVVELETGHLIPRSRLCNGRCDGHYRCEDEARCGGYIYGMFCEGSHRKLKYVKPSDVCDGYSYLCQNEEDEMACPNLQSLPSREICSAWKYGGANSKLIPIMNNTRCAAVWHDRVSLITDGGIMFPLCTNYMDQTNCTDPNRFEIYVLCLQN